jgi:hypothetical protein
MHKNGDLLTEARDLGQPGGNCAEYTAVALGNEVPDPIADLRAQLTAAADRGTPLSIGRRMQLTVRRVPSGFSVERGAGR